MSNFLRPHEIAEAVVVAGKHQVERNLWPMFILGILAGTYIAFGAQLSTVVNTGIAEHVGFGLSRFITGSVFTVGLILVAIGGAELFTGNSIFIVGLLAGEIRLKQIFRNWGVVYIANLLGSLLIVFIISQTGLLDGAVGVAAIKIASAKVNLTFSQAFYRAILCNWLVCLAVWLVFGARDVISKIFAAYFPIMAFVTSGFEHCVANMYFIPIGIYLKDNPAVLAAAEIAPDKLANLTAHGFVMNNLLPVTLGNVVGGAVFVAAAYAFSYLKVGKQ
ncbi:MAG: formate/nitrite transporter family protein [Gallionellaceae bacterium]|nr:formate/nitrite transporter family protein [Gallionellaceae bacterium]